MSALITALVLTTLLSLLLGLAYFRCSTNIGQIKEQEARRRKELIDEMKDLDRHLSGILRVLNCNVGGISKRISESAEIAEALQAHAPDLFQQCDGLAYWLHANDQFLNSLCAVAAERLDPKHQQRVQEMEMTDRAEIFNRIYSCAGLPAPTI